MGYASDHQEKELKPTIIEEGGITQVISKDGATAEQIELEPTFGQKVKNHIRRFWIYVGYPNMAQTGVNNSKLSVNSLVMSEPYQDNFHLKLDQVITSHSVFKPKLFGFQANLTLPGRGDDHPFLTVDVPQTTARDGEQVFIDQHVYLPSVDEFTRFTTTVMHAEEFEVIVVGRPKLQQGKLPKVSVDYNQTVRMKGMNRLKGFTLENMTMNIGDSLGKRSLEGRDSSGVLGIIDSLIHPNSNSSSESSSDDENGGKGMQSMLERFGSKLFNLEVPFTAVANIPNPTVMTLYLYGFFESKSNKYVQGNVTTYPVIDSEPIGRSIIHNVILRPGQGNRFNVTGTMNIAKSLPALNGRNLNIKLVSNESVYYGRHLDYFSKSLATNVIPYTVDLGSVLKGSLPLGLSSLL
ncbi:hypothetical protein KEM54_004071 [Ascosphaera aggregata]|nr:hypothetical protein KEM54_004071 [Ascosphaera aggregata]